LERDISDETSKKGEAKRILDDLTERHQAAIKEFENTLREAENEKKAAQKALDDMRARIQKASQDNSKAEVEANEKVIGRLSAEIAQI